MNHPKKRPGLLAGIGCILLALIAGMGSAAAGNPRAELNPLLDRLYEEHPRISEARAALEAARARRDAAGRPIYNPEIELDAERAESDVASLGLSQSIDLGDKRGARGQAAEAHLTAALAELDAARLELGGAFLQALAEFHTQRSLDELAAERARLMARFRDLAERRFRAGDINQVDLDLARQAALQAELAHARIRGELSAARERLQALLPGQGQQWPALPEELPSLEAIDFDALLPRLPAMHQAAAELEARRGELELSRRERVMDPTISVRAGRENNESLLGVTLAMPLHVRNSYKAEVQAASAELGSAEASLHRVRRERLAALRSAAERYRLIRTGWQQWQTFGAPSLSRQTSTLERLWRSGELGTTEYLVQLDQTLETRAEAMRIRGELWQRWFQWLTTSATLDDWLGRSTASAEEQEQTQ